MKGHWIKYSAAELAWLESNRQMVISDYHRAFCDTFERRDVSADNLNALRKRRGWHTGRSGRFEKGATPHNKGTPCAPGKGGNHPNARKTQFRPGARKGQAALNHKPIGTERWSKDGYRERKVHEGLPMQSRWKAVHRIEWEMLHGPVPKGMALKCLDGDKTNTAPSNWELISRSLLPRLAGGNRKQYVAYDEAPAALKPAILAIAQLESKARSTRKQA